jgi:hypothetical protein
MNSGKYFITRSLSCKRTLLHSCCVNKGVAHECVKYRYTSVDSSLPDVRNCKSDNFVFENVPHLKI